MLKISKRNCFVRNDLYLCKGMKKISTYFLTLCMATLVFYGGAGVNIISYCCGDCRSAGIEALIHNKCCEIHQHNHKHHTAHNHHSEKASCNHTTQNCCDTNHHSCKSCSNHSSGSCCSMERIDFDWNTQNTAEQEIDLSPIVFDLLSNELFIYSNTLLPFISEANTVMPNGPPLACPRDYLSILTVLLI